MQRPGINMEERKRKWKERQQSTRKAPAVSETLVCLSTSNVWKPSVSEHQQCLKA
jgi:hypothetical protein